MGKILSINFYPPYQYHMTPRNTQILQAPMSPAEVLDGGWAAQVLASFIIVSQHFRDGMSMTMEVIKEKSSLSLLSSLSSLFSVFLLPPPLSTLSFLYLLSLPFSPLSFICLFSLLSSFFLFPLFSLFSLLSALSSLPLFSLLFTFPSSLSKLEDKVSKLASSQWIPPVLQAGIKAQGTHTFTSRSMCPEQGELDRDTWRR